jgi:hypothetical protein
LLKFEGGAAPKLELPKSLSGLPYLASLKEVVLEGPFTDTELAYPRAELAENPNDLS